MHPPFPQNSNNNNTFSLNILPFICLFTHPQKMCNVQVHSKFTSLTTLKSLCESNWINALTQAFFLYFGVHPRLQDLQMLICFLLTALAAIYLVCIPVTYYSQLNAPPTLGLKPKSNNGNMNHDHQCNQRVIESSRLWCHPYPSLLLG